mmetsp:Transcript_16719/g.29920  ORF Transcript_16719/g.29920 Transcript_16719/m.29920 type:complete len:96 (+) Transcript_16719:482-769(+)
MCPPSHMRMLQQANTQLPLLSLLFVWIPTTFANKWPYLTLVKRSSNPALGPLVLSGCVGGTLPDENREIPQCSPATQMAMTPPPSLWEIEADVGV